MRLCKNADVIVFVQDNQISICQVLFFTTNRRVITTNSKKINCFVKIKENYSQNDEKGLLILTKSIFEIELYID